MFVEYTVVGVIHIIPYSGLESFAVIMFGKNGQIKILANKRLVNE